MNRRLSVRLEQIRGSLFFVPAVYVAGAILAAEVMRAFDESLARAGTDLPLALQSSPESARVLVSTIAGATITVAGIVFAITVVAIQLASSQFSPRVIPGFLRDFHQKQVMGFVVGTFTYCLLVLRAITGSSGSGTRGGVPHLSIDLAVVLAILAMLGIVAYLDHSARSLQVGEIVRRVARETRLRISQLYPHEAGGAAPMPMHEAALPEGDAFVVRANRTGWVRHLDVDAMLGALPDGSLAALAVRNGSFLSEGQAICRIWPVPDNPEPVEAAMRRALLLGGTRMMLQDAAFGIRQLVDIALRALSPGVNDPTTAYDVIVHLGDVMRDLLHRDLAPRVRVQDARRLVAAADLSHDDYVNRALDQIRQAAAGHAAMVAALLIVFGGLVADLEASQLQHRARTLRRQAELLVEGFRATQPLAGDLERILALARRHGLEAQT